MTPSALIAATAAILRHLFPQYTYDAIIGDSADDCWIDSDDMRSFGDKISCRVASPHLIVLCRSPHPLSCAAITFALTDLYPQFTFCWRLSHLYKTWEITATPNTEISANDVLDALATSLALGGTLR